MTSENENQELVDFLTGRGFTSEQVNKILKKLDEHDADINRQAIFDSVASGSFDLDAIIADALKDAS